MNAKEKLINGGYIENSLNFQKYTRYLDKIFDAIVDYGYVDKVIPEEKNNPNLGHKDTEEFCVFRVKDESKAEIEKIMQDLNIYLTKERYKKKGEMHEWFVFKSKNIPELKAIVRGCCKIKTKEAEEEKSNSMGGIPQIQQRTDFGRTQM